MKLKFIDSIRGIAILMVILVHTSQSISNLDYYSRLLANYGQMGVQLFFVASAYTLCLSSTRREDETSPTIKFGIRRYFRIAPAYYLGLVLYFFISVIYSKINDGVFRIPNQYSDKTIISNMTFLHGFYPPGNNNIVPGGWSIGTEMAFYALFPLLFYISKTKLHTWKNILFFFISGFILCQSILLLFNSYGIIIENNNFIYFNIINQLPVFLIGISYYFIKKNGNNKVWNWKLALLLFLVFTIFSNIAWHSGVKHFFSIVPVLSGISFIFLIEIFQRFSFLNNKFLIRLGQVSYSMYLFHVIFAHYTTGYLSQKTDNINSTIQLLIFYSLSVFLSFKIAILSEKHIEKPSIKLGNIIIEKLNIVLTTKNFRKQ